MYGGQFLVHSSSPPSALVKKGCTVLFGRKKSSSVVKWQYLFSQYAGTVTLV